MTICIINNVFYFQLYFLKYNLSHVFYTCYFSNLLLMKVAAVVRVTMLIFVSGGSGYSKGARSLVDLTYCLGVKVPSTSVTMVAVVLFGEFESMLRILARGKIPALLRLSRRTTISPGFISSWC